MTEGLIDKQWGFMSRKRCVDQIFSLKQIVERCEGFMYLEKTYDMVNTEVLW